MGNSAAGQTLETVRYYLQLAEAAGLSDRLVFLRHLETAIIYARSITFHLQKEYARVQGFGAWWAQQQQQLDKDRRAKFFLDSRNQILKVGSLRIRQNTTFIPGTGVVMTTSGGMQLTTSTQVTQTNELCFMDSEWPTTPALGLLIEHLSSLETIVNAAESAFGAPPT